jgi:hypothetical protein
VRSDLCGRSGVISTGSVRSGKPQGRRRRPTRARPSCPRPSDGPLFHDPARSLNVLGDFERSGDAGVDGAVEPVRSPPKRKRQRLGADEAGTGDRPIRRSRTLEREVVDARLVRNDEGVPAGLEEPHRGGRPKIARTSRRRTPSSSRRAPSATDCGLARQLDSPFVPIRPRLAAAAAAPVRLPTYDVSRSRGSRASHPLLPRPRRLRRSMSARQTLEKCSEALHGNAISRRLMGCSRAGHATRGASGRAERVAVLDGDVRALIATARTDHPRWNSHAHLAGVVPLGRKKVPGPVVESCSPRLHRLARLKRVGRLRALAGVLATGPVTRSLLLQGPTRGRAVLRRPRSPGLEVGFVGLLALQADPVAVAGCACAQLRRRHRHPAGGADRWTFLMHLRSICRLPWPRMRSASVGWQRRSGERCSGNRR